MPFKKTGGSPDDRLHPSFSWNPALRAGPAIVRDPSAFAAAIDNPRYPRSAAWCPGWTFHNSMGPINLWCAEALAGKMELRPGERVLDLGCGAADVTIRFARAYPSTLPTSAFLSSRVTRVSTASRSAPARSA